MGHQAAGRRTQVFAGLILNMRRGSWLLVVQSLIGLALLAAWLWIVDTRALAESLAAVEWGIVALAGALGLLSICLRALRWKLVLTPVARLGLFELWLIGLASSLINFVVPIRSGELARSFFLKQRHSIRMSLSLPTVALDRSFDLLAVLLIGIAGALGGLAVDRSVSTMLVIGAALFLAFSAFVTAAILSQQRLSALMRRMVPGWIGESLRRRMLDVLDGLLAGFASIGKQPRVLLPLLSLSLAAALVDAAVFVVLFTSLGAELAPIVISVGYALFALTFLVPGGPGYVGSMEAFGSLVFGGLGMQQAVAAGGIVVFHALNAVTLAVAGGLAFWALGVRPGSVWRSIQQAESGTPSSL